MINRKTHQSAAWSLALAALLLNHNGFTRGQGLASGGTLDGSVGSTFNEAVALNLYQLRLREEALEASRKAGFEALDLAGRRDQARQSAWTELRMFSERQSMALEQGLRRMQETTRTWADAESERSRSRHATLHSEHRQRLAERIAKGEEMGKQVVAALTGVAVETGAITKGSDGKYGDAIDATLEKDAADRSGATQRLNPSDIPKESPLNLPQMKAPYTQPPKQPVLPKDIPLVRTAASELNTDAPHIEARVKRDPGLLRGIASEELPPKRLSRKEEAVRDTVLKAATEIAYGRLMGEAAGRIVGRLFAVMDLLEPVELGRPEDAFLRYRTKHLLNELDREEESLRVLRERYTRPVQDTAGE